MTQGEYSTLIFYWAGEPHPERMDEILSTLAESGWARAPERVLPMAGTVLALEELDPVRKSIWRRNYPELYRTIERALATPKDNPFWTDFLIAQWFILRRDELMLQILDRAGAWGERDDYTVEMINTTCRYHGPFRHAAERLKLVTLVSGAAN
jgi:hypothetical protein